MMDMTFAVLMDIPHAACLMLPLTSVAGSLQERPQDQRQLLRAARWDTGILFLRGEAAGAGRGGRVPGGNVCDAGARDRVNVFQTVTMTLFVCAAPRN